MDVAVAMAGRVKLIECDSRASNLDSNFSALAMSSLISAVSWVKRGVSAQNPTKYVLDDKELERVSQLARIELEDARVELERAHEAAQSMGKGAEGDEADDADENEEDWQE
jgi:periodic tryptophan protein 1